MTRLLVCGGRNYDNFDTVSKVLMAHLPEIECVIQGGAMGADAQAREWCDLTGVPCITYAADWKSHGKAAGPIRNQQMLDQGKPDLVIAFPGGKGTEDMCRRAIRAGIKVEHIT